MIQNDYFEMSCDDADPIGFDRTVELRTNHLDPSKDRLDCSTRGQHFQPVKRPFSALTGIAHGTADNDLLSPL